MLDISSFAKFSQNAGKEVELLMKACFWLVLLTVKRKDQPIFGVVRKIYILPFILDHFGRDSGHFCLIYGISKSPLSFSLTLGASDSRWKSPNHKECRAPIVRLFV